MLLLFNMHTLIDSLQKRLSEPLPGAEAQYRMAHLSRRPPALDIPADARLAGVLALFYPKAGNWHLVFIERNTDNPNDRHSGQISFPGGKFESSDGSLRQTALRETEEEIGIAASSIQVIGSLSELYIPVSNFLVSPTVGFIDFAPQFIPHPGEVKSILEAPFSLFLEKDTIATTDLTLASGFVLRDVPYFKIGSKVLWGATAMIMSELLEVAGR